MSDPVPPAGPGDGAAPVDGAGPRALGARRRPPVLAAVAVLAVVLVGVAVAVLVGGDDGPSRLQATGTTNGVADASPVGRLGGRAALVRLREEMRDDDDLSSISLTGSHAVADLGTRAGGGRRLVIEDVPDGDVDVQTDDGGPVDEGAPVSRLDPDAPGRLLAAVLRGLGPGAAPRILETSALATTVGPAGGLEWRIELAGPAATRRWTGDLHGRHVVRASDGAPAPPEGSAGPAVRPSGVGATSLVRPANLRRQLDAIGARPDATGGVTYVDAEPGTLIVVLRQPVGSPDAAGLERIRRRTFTVDAAGGIAVSDVVARGPRDDGAAGVPLAAIDPGAPLRALRSIARRDGDDSPARVRRAEFRPADERSDEAAGWELELDAGGDRLSTWRARPDGRGVRR